MSAGDVREKPGIRLDAGPRELKRGGERKPRKKGKKDRIGKNR